MSRGAGRCQRRILAALDASPAITLRGLLGADFTKPQYIAAYRAMRTLQAKRTIAVGKYWDVASQTREYVLLRKLSDMDAVVARIGLQWHYDYWIKPKC